MTLGALNTVVIAIFIVVTFTGAEHVGHAPNFVLIFLDDVGFGDIGANAVGVQETPNIDALAASGMTFTDMHAAFSVCAPSRAALLTGRLAPRTGVFGNFAPDSSFGLSLEEVTIADILSNKMKKKSCVQYTNHIIGKWY